MPNDTTLFQIIFQSLRSQDTKDKFYQILENESPYNSLSKPFTGNLNDINEEVTKKAPVKIISSANVSFSEIYKEKKYKSKVTFVLCLIFAGCAVGIILFIILANFLNGGSNSGINDTLKLTSTIIPTLLSGTFFYFYNKVNDSLEKVEADRLKIIKLESMLKVVDLIPAGDLKNKAISEIISQIEL